ncbi:hypothetical protein PRIPAC_80989, partial [Pristionchus pacificus]|uniref:G protein-coupled receptor n=1 Tax=Pristionchus pacificus TaxID=54126 RepID=A0A2A6CLB0_PRIPA
MLSLDEIVVIRWLVIEGKNPTSRSAFALTLCICLPIPTILTGLFIAGRRNDDIVQNSLEIIRPEYDAHAHVVMGHADIRMMAILFIFGVAFWLVYVAILYLRSRILASIERQSSTLSDKSRKMHQKFVAMLTAQAALPILSALGISTFFVAFFDMFHHPALEFPTLM